MKAETAEDIRISSLSDAEVIIQIKQLCSASGITTRSLLDYLLARDMVPRGTFTIDIAVIARPNNMRAVLRSWNSVSSEIRKVAE